MKPLLLADTEAMLTFGHRLANKNLKTCVIFLQGPLGAGKTTFVRGLLGGLGYTGSVKSPTYTLVETYILPERVLYHWDMYRVVDPNELEFMGIRDYLQEPAWWLVEWPEKVIEMLPAPDLTISFEVKGSARQVLLEPHTDIGKELCQKWAQ